MAELDVSELVGLAELLDTAPEQAIRAAHVAGIAGVKKIQADAVADAPEDTGLLKARGLRRRSWRTKDSCHSDVFTVPIAHPTKGGGEAEPQNVGFHVEYGNSTTPPNPFLSSQMAAAGPAYEAAVLAGLDPLVKPAPEVTE